MKPPNQESSSVPRDSENESAFLERVMRYQDGTLRGAELAMLEAELREDPHKLKLFADVQMQSVMTRECLRNAAFAIKEEADAASEFDTPIVTVSSVEQATKSSRRTRSWGKAIIPIAILSVIGLAVIGIARWRQPVQATTDRGVALLTHDANIEWLDSLNSRRPGNVLEPGWLRLKSGAALIEFYSGARLVLEGSAELQLVSVNEGYLVPLAVSIGGRDISLPDDYLAFTCYDSPHNMELGFVFTPAGEAEEFEGQVTEFIRYDTATISSAILSSPSSPNQLLLPIACDAGGNYLYLDLTKSPMAVVDVNYATGKLSVIADSFNEFVEMLYTFDA